MEFPDCIRLETDLYPMNQLWCPFPGPITHIVTYLYDIYFLLNENQSYGWHEEEKFPGNQ
jgi:hypothetical protein